MQLTKSYSLADWVALRSRLKDKQLVSDDWRSAIELIKERIEERYLLPIRKIIVDGKSSGEGFLILTIECALIEFFATLHEGRLFSYNRNPLAYYYSRSGQSYIKFLQTDSVFEGIFHSSSPGIRPIMSAKDFYENVRCPLVHEAQTRNNWKIKVKKKKEEDLSNKQMFAIEDSFKIIYRTALFHGLTEYFNRYCTHDLTASTKRAQTLRKHLARKIDHIAELPSDQSFWWK